MSEEEAVILQALIRQYLRDVDTSPAVQSELHRIARGELAREVVAATGTSYEAVRRRRSRLYRTLGVTRAAEVVSGLLALSLGQLSGREETYRTVG